MTTEGDHNNGRKLTRLGSRHVHESIALALVAGGEVQMHPCELIERYLSNQLTGVHLISRAKIAKVPIWESLTLYCVVVCNSLPVCTQVRYQYTKTNAAYTV
eukprot:SAG11_NODE_2888_length_2865_cov_1.928778_3_plen_102_part_00